MKENIRLFITGLMATISAIVCLNINARIAVLDITSRNYESETSGDFSRQVYSAKYLCDVAGYEYFVTESLEEAMQEDFILFACMISNTSFSRESQDSVSSYNSCG